VTRSSREDLPDLIEAREQGIKVVRGARGAEAGAHAGVHAKAPEQRLAAVLARLNGHAVRGEDLGHVVGAVISGQVLSP